MTAPRTWPRQWATWALGELPRNPSLAELLAVVRQIPRRVPGVGVVRPIAVAHLRVLLSRAGRR